jgi:outer membrane protein assembly factor BamD
MVHYLIIIASLLLVSGCKSSKIEDEPIIPVAELYASGEKFLKEKKFKAAAKEFEKIYFQHPGSEFTPYAELMEAYSLYKSKQYLSCIDVLTAFTQLHPANEYLDYVYYLKILSYLAETTDVYHGQESVRQAKMIAEGFIVRFPNSKYLPEVKNKLKLLNDYLSGHEIVVGNYYIAKNNPIAAILNYQRAKVDYANNVYTAEAIYRLAMTSKMFGLTEEESFYSNELKTKYPNSYWLNRLQRKNKKQ